MTTLNNNLEFQWKPIGHKPLIPLSYSLIITLFVLYLLIVERAVTLLIVLLFILSIVILFNGTFHYLYIRNGEANSFLLKPDDISKIAVNEILERELNLYRIRYPYDYLITLNNYVYIFKKCRNARINFNYNERTNRLNILISRDTIPYKKKIQDVINECFSE